MPPTPQQISSLNAGSASAADSQNANNGTQTNFAANVAATPGPGQSSTVSTATTPYAAISSPSQVVSTDASTLGKPVVTSSQLPQPQPYTPAPIPDISTITAQATKPTDASNTYTAIQKSMADLTTALGGQTDYANGLQTQYGVPTLTATANDLSANIQRIQNQRDSVQQQLSSQYGADASKGYLSFEQQSVDSELAAKQSAYASTLATINGQLSTAKSYIDTAVANKYTPITNQINALKAQADLVNNTLDKEQQKSLAIMTAQLQDRSNQIAANKAISTSMLEKIAVAAANSANPAPSYIVSQAQAAALGDNPASALAIISPYLKDPLAAQKEAAEIAQSKAATADSYAGANLKNAQASFYNTPSTTTSSDPATAALSQTPTATGASRYTGSDPTSVNAQAILDGLNAPPVTRSNTPANAHLMSVLNTLSMQQTGHAYDQQAAKASYDFRTKTATPFFAKLPTAVTTIGNIAALAKEANVSSISDLNNVVNSGRAGGYFATAEQQSAAKQLQSALSLNSDDLGLLLGTGQGSDSKLALASAIFNPNGGVRSTNDLTNYVTTTLEHKATDYATQAGIANPDVYAKNIVQNAFNRSSGGNTDYTGGASQTTASGKTFDVAGALKAGYTMDDVTSYLKSH